MTITHKDVADALEGFDPAYRYQYDCSCGHSNPNRVYAIEPEAVAAAKRHGRRMVAKYGPRHRCITKILRCPWPKS